MTIKRKASEIKVGDVIVGVTGKRYKIESYEPRKGIGGAVYLKVRTEDGVLHEHDCALDPSGATFNVEVDESDPKNSREHLEVLVKIGEQFRRTPIVDDDFPQYRDRFDLALDAARRFIETTPPTRKILTTVDGCMGLEEVYIEVPN